MNQVDTIALEHMAKRDFGITIDVASILLDRVSVSPTCRATVFMTSKKQLMCMITGQSRVTMGDIRKIISRMGLKAEKFLPPKGQPTYFDDIARTKFEEVFPGRTHVSSDDLAYYRTLAPYNPAMVRIEEVKNGEILQYDSDAHGGWRVGAKFSYRRIKTS